MCASPPRRGSGDLSRVVAWPSVLLLGQVFARPAALGLLGEEKGNGKIQHFKRVIARCCESS